MIVYKIRDKKTGLYSNGGWPPSFSKNGKIWKTKAHLKTHLKQVKWLNSWEIIEFEIREISIKSINDFK